MAWRSSGNSRSSDRRSREKRWREDLVMWSWQRMPSYLGSSQSGSVELLCQEMMSSEVSVGEASMGLSGVWGRS